MKHIGTVKRLAAKFAQSGLLDYDDLVGEGMWVYATTIKRYDESFGVSFNTYLYRRVHGCFMNLRTKEMNKIEYMSRAPREETANSVTPEAILVFREMMANLSAETQMVIRITLDMASAGGRPTRTEIQKEIISRKAMNWKSIRISFNELSYALN